MDTIKSINDIARSLRLSLRNFNSGDVAEALIDLPDYMVLSAYGMSSGDFNGFISTIKYIPDEVVLMVGKVISTIPEDDMDIINDISEFLLSSTYTRHSMKCSLMSLISKLSKPTNVSRFILGVISLESAILA